MDFARQNAFYCIRYEYFRSGAYSDGNSPRMTTSLQFLAPSKNLTLPRRFAVYNNSEIRRLMVSLAPYNDLAHFRRFAAM